MNMSISIDWIELSIQWMLTCGHFLWQGLAVALIFLVIERLVATRASTRYAMACTALLSLPVCVVLTFALINNSRGSVVKTTSPATDRASILNDSLVINSPAIAFDPPVEDMGNVPAIPPASTIENEGMAAVEAVAPQLIPVTERLRFLAPLISAVYAIVVGLLLSRTGLSLLGSMKFGNAAQRVTDSQFLQVVQAQAARLKLKTAPIVATCLRVSSPVVVGITRPMILLPPSLMCGLDPTQLAAILSHEMAHIRRYDLLFNLIQRVIESLFFFHPITWWLSRRVTIERENCCDDVAASNVGRLTYAEALVQMATLCLEKHRSRSQALATLAADGGNSSDFGYRIRRLIDAHATPQIRVTKRNLGFCLATIALMGASIASFAQSRQTPEDEPRVNQSDEVPLVDGIQWSTWGECDGLLSGARLISPEGGVHPGQPVVVEYRLKNVAAETRTLTCYIRDSWKYITLGSKNRISDLGFGISDKPTEITIEPGQEYVAASHTATIDTRGLSPGDYQVALGSAFYYPVEEGGKSEIPHRGSISLTILGEPKAPASRPLDKSIHWGDAIAGLSLGAKFYISNNGFAVDEVVEADLWVANVTSQEIECSILLPHPMDGWLFNVENDLGDTIMLERPPRFSSPFPQQFYKLKLAAGEVKALTGDRIEGQPDAFAGPRAKFEVASKENDGGWADYTIKGRLVSQGGDYSAIYNVTLERPDIPGLRIELDTANVPFTVSKPSTDGPAVEPADILVEGNRKAAENLDKASDTGVLQGRISLDGAVPKLSKLRVPTPTTPRLDKRPTDEARKKYEASLVEIEDESLQVDAENGLANAFVFLAKTPSDWQPTKTDLQPITFEIKDYRFEPRAAIIPVGQDVRLNHSGAAADNFSFQPLKNDAQNRLVREGTEITLERPFMSPEKRPIQAKSDMNPWKMTFLLPLDHPFAAVTDTQGRFSILGLPAGTHTFLIWHERTGWLENSLSVDIEAGQTTEINRSYGIDRFNLAANQIKANASLTDVLWGEPVGGMRLGIRQSEFARRNTVLRHGEHLDYEVWIKNETDEVVRIARDPSTNYDPKLQDDGSINVVGWSMGVSFMIPPEEFAKAELILPPGHAARRFLTLHHSASIRPPGSTRGRFGAEPLHLEPGKYSVYAQVDDLKSGVEEVEIVPAARVQFRKSSRPTERSRAYAAEDPSDAIIEWLTSSGEKQEALISWDGGVLVDERDLASAEIVPVEGQPDQYSIALKLRPESSSWLSRCVASYSLWDDPDMVAILLDGKMLGAVRIPAQIPGEKLIIPVGFPQQQAEATIKEIQAAIAVKHEQPKTTESTNTGESQPQGVTLLGEIKMPKDELLFRRQVKQLPDTLPSERPREFNGDSIDPEDGRLVHELTWQDVQTISVTIKANDGRDYLKSVKADQEGKFRFDEVLPISSYQVDVRAVLTLDDDSQSLDGEPRADLLAGTQLLQVKQGDAGDKLLAFELYPAPYNNRVLHADPSQRTTIRGTLTENERPVPNAKIILYSGVATRWKVAESLTNEQGVYRFENVRGNYLGVQVKHDKLVPADGKNWRDIEIEFGTTHRLDMAMTAGGFITGQLLDDNGQPRADLPLRIMLTAPGIRKGSTNFAAYATTDATGTFTSEPLFPGTYVIEENGLPYAVLGEVAVKANETTKL